MVGMAKEKLGWIIRVACARQGLRYHLPRLHKVPTPRIEGCGLNGKPVRGGEEPLPFRRCPRNGQRGASRMTATGPF